MKHKVTDANGKIFEFTDSEITDMTTDLPENPAEIHDSQEVIDKMKNFKPQIVDSDNNEIDINKFLDDVKNGKQEIPSSINVLFEATHSGINKNSWHYFSDSMQNDAASFLAPYAKPMLKNHDSFSEPLGRVIQAYTGKSELNEERDCINLEFNVTDKEAIEKFLDGRYKTSSVGGSVGHIQCSICGKDILKDGKVKFCGHWRGEVYNGQKAVWNARDIQYREMSVVNSPADDWAQVKRITIPSTKKHEGNSDSTDENTILANVDSALRADVSNNEPASSAEDNNNSVSTQELVDNENENPNNDPVNEPNDEQENNDITLEDKIVSLNNEIDKLNDNINSLKSQIESKDAEINSTKEELKTLQDENESIKSEKEKIQIELNDSNSRFLSLASMQKKMMAKHVADNEVLVNKLNKDEYDNRVTELMKCSSIELKQNIDSYDVFNTSDTTNSQKPVGTVSNPGLVNNNDNNVIDTTKETQDTENTDNNINNQEDDSKTTSNYNYEDSIINSILR